MAIGLEGAVALGAALRRAKIAYMPKGGMYAPTHLTADISRSVLRSCLQDLVKLSPDELHRRRHERLRKLATCVTGD